MIVGFVAPLLTSFGIHFDPSTAGLEFTLAADLFQFTLPSD